MSKVFLCNVTSLDITYDNVLSFSNEESRFDYFTKSRYVTDVDVNVKYDGGRTHITIPMPIEHCNNIDYVVLSDKLDKHYFYFVTYKSMVNTNNSLIELSLDVWTTYMFDYQFLHSFVDRCHVNRWNNDIPTKNLEDELVGVGDYIEISKHEELGLLSDSMIITTSVPIGLIDNPSTDLGSNGSNDGNNLNLPSEKGFRYIKGYEGFAPTGGYFSGENFKTAGYGINERDQETLYNKLKPFPCGEELASEILCDMIEGQFSKSIMGKLLSNGVLEEKITTQRFDVLCSLGMNTGLGNLYKSTLWSMIIANIDDTSIPTQIEKSFTTSNGEVLNGLVKRRKDEAVIWKSGLYNMNKIVKYNNNGSIEGYVTDNNGDGFIPLRLKIESNGSELGDKICQSARKLIGKPYVWGGNYPPLGNSNGTDCSGICQWAFNDNGLGHLVSGRWTTTTIIKEGKSVLKENIEIGDLILTPGHVVIYSGRKNGTHRIIEAPRTGLNIRERDYNFPSNITSIRRLI